VLIIPAMTVKYHLPLGPIRPYVGAGPAVFLVMGERPGATAAALGVTRTSLSSDLGVAIQFGFDVPIKRPPQPDLRREEVLDGHHRPLLRG
jgi:outer membrane protein